ncbi:hypothetical protein HQQ80_11825 [Microbacteriaceae bacterium VKM Ac-2855]|nr:hypothetical protein [Microbacteriaceae bacterium VKM Ac-2855]
MSVISVILAPSGPLAGVRDALADWSAARLIDRFYWVEPHMIQSGTFSALSVHGGAFDGATLNALAGSGRIARIRLVVLVPAITGMQGVGTAVEQELAAFLESSFGSAPVTRIRAIVTRADDRATLPDLAIDGWHNVLLSPEDSSGPGIGQTRLGPTKDPFDLGAPAAAAVAGLTGLWSGIDGSPLDAETLAYGGLVRMSRSYYRRLGTAELERALRTDVLSMERGLPLPTQFGAAATYVEDAALATQDMAEQLWARHPGVLRGPRDTLATEKVKPIGAWEALKMFFAFILAAVRGAPRAWLAGVVNRVRADAAAAVHGLVFGAAPSAYAVVVQGVTADGMPASWLDLQGAAVALDKALDDGGGARRDHEAHADLSALWQDYVAASLTLADGGDRVTGLTPVQIGTQRGVLRRPGSIVPAVEDAFDAVPPHLAASIGIATAEPFDVLGTFALGGRLRRVAEQPMLGVAASATLEQLGSWRSEHSETFAARVGTRIGESLFAVREEIAALLEEIRQAASADDLLAAESARNRRLARTLRILAIIFGAAAVTVAVLLFTGVVGLTIGLIILASVLLLWFVVALWVFIVQNRRLFALLNARKELLARNELARRNIRHAVRDARRLTDAYSQYLAWSRVVGSVLRAPFGRSSEAAVATDVDVVDLPQSVRLGAGVVDANAVGSASIELRRDIFAIGWLQGCWDSALAGASKQIGPRGVEIEAEPRTLFRQRGSGEDSLLPLWTAALQENGVAGAVGDETWSRVLADLDGPRAAVADRLLAQVSDARLSGGQPVPYAIFMGNTDSVERLRGDRLDDAPLSDSARANGGSVVERPDSRVGRRGLSRVVSLTELTAAIPAYEFIAYQDPEIFDPSSLNGPGWAVAPATNATPTAPTRVISSEPSTLDLPDPFGGQPF